MAAQEEKTHGFKIEPVRESEATGRNRKAVQGWKIVRPNGGAPYKHKRQAFARRWLEMRIIAATVGDGLATMGAIDLMDLAVDFPGSKAIEAELVQRTEARQRAARCEQLERQAVAALDIEIGDVVQLDPQHFGGVRFGIVRDFVGDGLLVQDRPYREVTSDTRIIAVDACERIGRAVWIES